MKRKNGLFVGIVCVFLSTAGMAAPITTHQSLDVETSGFLKDYSALKPGEEGEAHLLFINADANFRKYKKILMDPIAVYAIKDSDNLEKIPQDELRNIVNYLDAAVRDRLEDDYRFVSKPGPDVMRLRIAVTDAKGANVLVNTTSSVTPVGLAVSGVKKLSTGASTGVGRATIEVEIVDAQTGERLAAAVDERVGTKLSSFKKWQGVKDAFDYWAKKLDNRLKELRAK